MPSIRRWLLRCIKLLEVAPDDQGSRRIIDRINATHFPELFDPPQTGADNALWSAILNLNELGILKLERKSRRLDPHAPPWDATALVFQPEAEVMVRQWLDRPRVRPDQNAWLEALKEVVDKFADASLIQNNPFPLLNHSPKDILSRLLLIPTLLKRGKASSYKMSAELFWGHSNLLRDKEDWLCQLLDLPASAFKPRPLMVNVTFPIKPAHGILIIENLDSYASAVDGLWPTGNDLILVHAQDINLFASSIRQEGRVRFHVHSNQSVSETLMRDFKLYWLENSASRNWPMYAITNMDWNGIKLFSTLKQQFPGLEAWKPGYKVMMEEAKNGNYHSPEEAGKTEQQSMTHSGSNWLDQHIIPLLEDGKFVDQAIIHISPILS